MGITLFQEARVGPGLHAQLLETLELGVLRVGGKPKDDGLCRGEEGSHVAQPLQRYHAVRLAPVSWKQDMKGLCEKLDLRKLEMCLTSMSSSPPRRGH